MYKAQQGYWDLRGIRQGGRGSRFLIDLMLWKEMRTATHRSAMVDLMVVYHE